MCAQLLLGTIATLSSYEHRVAICTATDSLRHLHVRVLCPVLERTSSECLNFCPCPQDSFGVFYMGAHWSDGR